MSSKYNLHYEKIGKETRCIEDEIPFEIPKNWSWVRLGNYIKYDIGKTPPRKEEEFWVDAKYPWISIADMIADGKIYLTKDKINGFALRTHFKDKLVPIGTLIMSFKLTVGRVSILGVETAHNEAIISIYPFIDDDKIATNFLFKFLPLLSEQGKTKKAIKGNTLNSDSLNNILLPLPPLFEQKRIVDKLEEILPLVEKYKENKEKLDELNLNFPSKLKKSILDYAIKGKLVEQNLEDESVEILLQKIRQEKQRLIKDKKIKADKFLQSTIFIGEDNSPYEKIGKETRCIADEIPFEIPQSWSWVRLGEICQIYTGDSINQTQKLTKYTNLEDGRCYIATKDVGFDGSIDYENGVKIPFEESKFKIAPRSSVLLCVEGGSAGKKIGYLDCDVCFGNKLCCFNPLVIEPRFIYYYLQSQIFIDGFKQKMSGIISGISLNSIKTIAIAIPPLPEQKRIVEKIESLLALLKP